LEAFTRERPDVLVSDIEMPEEDGYTLIRKIRALSPEAGSNVPAAAVTAFAGPTDRMKVLGAGFNIHVAKPVQPAELAIVVASLVGRRVEPSAATPTDMNSHPSPRRYSGLPGWSPDY
jgi:CheY-like chemotaxis protein